MDRTIHEDRHIRDPLFSTIDINGKIGEQQQKLAD